MRTAELDVAVLSTVHDAADARLHRVCAALVAQGLSVGLWATGRSEHGPASVVVRTLPRRGLARRMARAIALPVSVRAPVQIVVDPELLPPALAVARLRGTAVVADVHEDYRRLLDDRPWARGAAGLLGRLVADGATVAARHADVTVVADEHLRPRRARHRLVVRNLPPPGSLPAPSTRDAVPRAVYVGDVRRSRGLVAMVDAVLAAAPWELDIVGPVSDEDRAWVASRTGGTGRVRMHGRQPPTATWQLARGAWVGLALLEPTPAFVRAVPTKLYEYLASGLAVVTTDLPGMRHMVEASAAGLVVAGAEECAAVLRGWHRDPATLDVHRSAATAWARQAAAGVDPFTVLATTVAALRPSPLRQATPAGSAATPPELDHGGAETT